MPVTKLHHLHAADLIRSLLLSWMTAVTIEYLLLPVQLRSLDSLDGLGQMSFSRVLLLTCCLWAAFAGITLLLRTTGVQRWCISCVFSILAAVSLLASFSWAFSAACVLLLAIGATFSSLGWNKRPEPGADTEPGRPIYCWLTFALSAVFFLFVSAWTVGRVYSFSSPTYDFGIFSQMFYYMRTTGLPMTTLERDGLLSHFAVHVSPIYYLLLPFYCLVPIPATLQVLQAAVITSSVIPLWKLCGCYGLRRPMRLLLCAAGLLYPALSGACGYDIHENCFLAPLLLWLLYGLSTKKTSFVCISAFLTLMVKEDAAVYVAVIGLYQAVTAIVRKNTLKSKAFLTGILLFLGAVGWFLLVTTYLSEHGDGVMTYRYNNFLYEKTGSLIQVVQAVLMNPMKAVYECTDPEKLPFIAQTLLPLLGLPLLTRRYERLILLIPYILVNLMPDYTYQHNIFFQYTFGSTALLLYLTAVNLADLQGNLKKYLLLAAAVSVSAACFFTAIFPTAIRYPIYCLRNAETYGQIRKALSTIPEDASVAASTFYTTQLSQRELVYDLGYCSKGHLLESEYVAISVSGQKDLEDLLVFLEDNGYCVYTEIPDILIIYAAQ